MTDVTVGGSHLREITFQVPVADRRPAGRRSSSRAR